MTRTFSRAGYKNVLATAQSCGYQIRPIRDAIHADDGPLLLLRHDVDLSLRLALEMAELEHDCGLASSYFILPHNDFYDAFSPEGRRALSRLIELGHEVGLHCDAAIYSEQPVEFHREVRCDIETLENITGRKVVSASQHIPADRRAVDLSKLVEIDTYAPWVREKFAYVSDSSMSWRSETAWDVLPSRKNVQLLTHPIWWMAPGASRQQKFRYLKKQEVELQAAKLDRMLAFIEQYLADRERLDARLAQQWRELHGDKAPEVPQVNR
jgi:hypothetical protein